MPYSLVLKSEKNWRAHTSGDMRKLNTDYLFETDNRYGFPVVRSSKNFHAEDTVPFHVATSRGGPKSVGNLAVNFFIDDYKFEKLWVRPRDFIEFFKNFGGIISPTFSVWSNQPYALNLFNMYRSRWCTRFFQDFDIPVLVDVRWADESSYDYCFSGIEKNSPVIVNTVGTKMLDNRQLFTNGFYAMLKGIEPSDLFVYGEYMPVKFEKYFDSVTYYDSFWKKQREKIKERMN